MLDTFAWIVLIALIILVVSAIAIFFIVGSLSETIVGVEIRQIDARYIEPGEDVEAAFEFLPGATPTGKVVEVLQAVSTGQVQALVLAVTPKTLQVEPFVVRVKLDDVEASENLPAGSVGAAAIFTDHIRPNHIIRRALLRQIAILNYVNPF